MPHRPKSGIGGSRFAVDRIIPCAVVPSVTRGLRLVRVLQRASKMKAAPIVERAELCTFLLLSLASVFVAEFVLYVRGRITELDLHKSNVRAVAS